jgi:hypothetical protein
VYPYTHVENVLFLDRKIVDIDWTRPFRKWVLEPRLDIFKRHVFSELEEKMSEFFWMKISRKKKGRIQRCREVTRGRQKSKEGRGLGSQKDVKKGGAEPFRGYVSRKKRGKRGRGPKKGSDRL